MVNLATIIFKMGNQMLNNDSDDDNHDDEDQDDDDDDYDDDDGDVTKWIFYLARLTVDGQQCSHYLNCFYQRPCSGFFHFAFLSLLLFLLDLIEQPCIILILPGFSKRIFFCKVAQKRRNKEMKRTQIQFTNFTDGNADKVFLSGFVFLLQFLKSDQVFLLEAKMLLCQGIDQAR